MITEEEKKAIEYFKRKIENKLPLYEETYIDGKPYRRNILQLETNFTEEQANNSQVVLNLISKLQKENEELKQQNNNQDEIINQFSPEWHRLTEENEKKDKVMDWLVEEIHSVVNLGEFIDINIDKLNTKEEIKQYFYEKVEKENDTWGIWRR